MIPFINPWWFVDPEDMPELPDISDKTYKILKWVCIIGLLIAAGLFVGFLIYF
jgi:hypothetical protein